MNIVLIHLGLKLPDYFWTCAKQVRKHFKGSLYLILPSAEIPKAKLSGLGAVVFTQEFLSQEPEAKNFQSVSWMKKEYGDFWSLTFERLFYLEAFIRKFDLSDTIHIENDVLLYRDPDLMKPAFQKLFHDRVAINPVGERYATFAYGYVPNYKAIKKMNAELLSLLSLGKNKLIQDIGEEMVNEMMLLKLCADKKTVGYLPSLPYGEYSEGLEELGCLFDPASYGQNIGGTRALDIGWTGDHHFIGREIKAGKITAKFDKCPFVETMNGIQYLANLHVHSKELEKYV